MYIKKTIFVVFVLPFTLRAVRLKNIHVYYSFSEETHDDHDKVDGSFDYNLARSILV